MNELMQKQSAYASHSGLASWSVLSQLQANAGGSAQPPTLANVATRHESVLQASAKLEERLAAILGALTGSGQVHGVEKDRPEPSALLPRIYGSACRADEALHRCHALLSSIESALL